jgi:methanogenic corrinoid protein MtbC1
MLPPSADPSIDDEPIYNVHAVAQQTGLSAATLRAWERRYGFPAPQRTASGYRLYSSRDIQLLHWLKGQVDGGLAISQAVALLSALRAGGRDPVGSGGHAPAAPLLAPAQNDDELIARLYDAACRFDEPAFEGLLNHAFAVHSVEDASLNVITPLMQRVGAGWQANELSVQAEHFASNLVRQRVITLLHAAPPPRRSGDRAARLAAACAPGEWHELGLLMITLFLRRDGWPVTYLGQNVPVERIIDTVREIRPGVVLLSAATLLHAAGVLDAAEALAELPPAERPHLLYGGRVFNALPALRARIPGTFAGADALAAGPLIASVAAALHTQTPSATAPAPATALAALRALRRHEDQLVATTVERVLRAPDGRQPPQVSIATRYLLAALVSALRFAQPDALVDLARWVGNTLPGYGVAHADMQDHVQIFGQVVAGLLPRAESDIVQRYLSTLAAALLRP